MAFAIHLFYYLGLATSPFYYLGIVTGHFRYLGLAIDLLSRPCYRPFPLPWLYY